MVAESMRGDSEEERRAQAVDPGYLRESVQAEEE
jgi:hypothetical protein